MSSIFGCVPNNDLCLKFRVCTYLCGVSSLELTIVYSRIYFELSNILLYFLNSLYLDGKLMYTLKYILIYRQLFKTCSIHFLIGSSPEIMIRHQTITTILIYIHISLHLPCSKLSSPILSPCRLFDYNFND